MNKKLISLAAAVAMLASTPVADAQAALINSATALNIQTLSDYEAFALDKSTGEWSYTSNETLSALDAIKNDYVRSYTGTGTLLFYVTLSGNAFENTVLPTFNMYFIGSTEVGAHAVSLLVDGIRYDFEVTNEVTDIDGYRAELMSAPLNADGVDMLNSLEDAEEFSILLHGEKKFYSSDIEIKAEYDDEREKIQAASVTCALGALEKYAELGQAVEPNRLIKAWEDANQLTCGYTRTDMNALPATDIKLSGDFQMLKPGDSSESVKQLQKLLSDMGYFFEKPTSRYNQQTRAAVLRAQKLYGLTRTGSADSRLINMLENGATGNVEVSEDVTYAEQAATGEVSADAGTRYTVADVARVHVDSYRFAAKILPESGDSTAAISASNADDTLIIFEGGIQNLSAAEMDVYWDNKAQITLDGKYTYECTLAIEQDGGKSFGTALLPLGESRLTAYAQVPAELAGAEGEWTLTLTLGETTLTYVAE